METPEQSAAIAALKTEAKRRTSDGADLEARVQYLLWKDHPDSSTAKRQRISAVFSWLSFVWGQYKEAKDRVLSGDTSAKMPDSPQCPFTFWDIAGA